MKVLVTGATGFVGFNVVKLLINKKYDVIGLCRNEESAQKLKNVGVTPLIGNVVEPLKIVETAKTVDAVIHLAFNHDFTRYAESIKEDIRFSEAIIEALKGTNKPFITTSSVAVGGETAAAPSDDSNPIFSNVGRGAAESLVTSFWLSSSDITKVIKAAEQGMRTSVVRLPPFVYGQNGPGFIATLIQKAKEKDVSYYIEGKTNQVATVHVEDAATLYVDALEKGKAGAVYNGAIQNVPFKQIVEAVGQLVGVPVKGISAEEAATVWGPLLGNYFGWDMRSIAPRAEKELGWKPAYSLAVLDEILTGSYKQGFQN